MNRQDIEKEKQAIIAQITKYLPNLKLFFDDDRTLKEYSANLAEFSIPEEYRKRQQLVVYIIEKKFRKLFGARAFSDLQVNPVRGLHGASDTGLRQEDSESLPAASCGASNGVNITPPLAFNIADHHQVLNHPLLISANVLSSIPKFFQQSKQDAIVVVSSGDVPPNGYFSKNGFEFHGKRIPIFTNKEHEACSYLLPKRDFDFIQNLKKADRWKEFTDEEKIFLAQEYERINAIDFARCDSYTDQVTCIVKDTWPRLFAESLRSTLPELLYITQEELTTEYLRVLLKEDNVVSRCLFDPDFRNAVLDNFRGIVVTWRENEGKGTHFFWRRYPGRPQTLRLYAQGDHLVPHDPRFQDAAIPFNRESILDLLEKKEIFPSLFLIFLVLNFYAGVKPLAGYGSVVYLELIKQAWLKTLRSFHLEEEVSLVETVDTNGFVAGIPLFFKRIEEKVRTLYAYDIIFDGGIGADYLSKVFAMKLKDFFGVGAADMYDYYASKYIPSDKRMTPKVNFDDLANVTFDWL